MEVIRDETMEIIAILVVCLALTGGNIWLSRDKTPANWEAKELNGIIFRHPPGIRFTSNTPTDWIPGYWDGGVQGEPTSGELEIYGVFWITNKARTTEQAREWRRNIAKEENPG